MIGLQFVESLAESGFSTGELPESRDMVGFRSQKVEVAYKG